MSCFFIIYYFYSVNNNTLYNTNNCTPQAGYTQYIDVYSAKMAEIPLPVTKTAKIDKMFIEKRAFLSFVSENNTNKKTFKIFLQS